MSFWQKKLRGVTQLSRNVGICLLLSCSSGSDENKIISSSSASQGLLEEIIEHPQLHINQEITVEGVILDADLRKLGKGASLLMVKLTSLENVIEQSKSTSGRKYLFIDKLRQAEDLLIANQYKGVYVSFSSAEKYHQQGCDLKIAAKRLAAMQHYFSGEKKPEVSKAFESISKGYMELGEAYLMLHKTALETSIGDESSSWASDKSETRQFEESLLTSANLLLEFALKLEDKHAMIHKGYHSFSAAKVLNSQRSHELLTYSSLLGADSWKLRKDGQLANAQMASAIAEVIKLIGNGDKLVNQGLLELSESLNKTAIAAQTESIESLKCVYTGFNGAHLRRCLSSLNGLSKHSPVKIRGTLVRSNLREEMDVLWLKTTELEIDGVKISLSYGDESGALRNAMEIYEWAEDVEKGK
jgi:hypothetical protein